MKYAMISASDRSIYEVILPDEPCKIHFDLEVSMCLNFGFTPDIQDKLSEKFCSIIRELHILGTKENSIKPSRVIHDFSGDFPTI